MRPSQYAIDAPDEDRVSMRRADDLIEAVRGRLIEEGDHAARATAAQVA